MQWYFFQGQRSRDYLWHKLAPGNFIVEFQVKELDENGRQNEVDESGQRTEGLEGWRGRIRDYEKLPSFQYSVGVLQLFYELSNAEPSLT